MIACSQLNSADAMMTRLKPLLHLFFFQRALQDITYACMCQLRAYVCTCVRECASNQNIVSDSIVVERMLPFEI